MRLAWITAGFLTIGILAMACSTGSPEAEKVGATTSNVQGGKSDTTHKYAVGVKSEIGGNLGICSGALILPNLIATARHCVSDSPELIDCQSNPEFGDDRPESSMTITTNPNLFGSGSGWYKVKKIFRPTDKHVCGNDIALIQLEKSIPDSEATPITPGVQYPMWDESRYAAAFTAIGYGRTSPATQGSGNGGAGTRRILSDIEVKCIPGSSSIDCPPGYVNDAEFIGGDGICQGDSGSSAYEEQSFEAGKPVSFGVLSRGGASQDGSQCQGSIYSRFDSHRDFVLAAALEASNNWTLYSAPDWTNYVAPPSGGKAPPGSEKKTDLGGSCAKSKECESAKCATVGDEKVCVKSCASDETACDEGDLCNANGACVPATPEDSSATGGGDIATDTNGTLPSSEEPQTITTTTSTCAMSRGTSSSSMGWLAGLGLAIAAVRRRRS